MKKLKTWMVVFAVGFIAQAHAQESINAAGAEATGSGGNASFTIGEVVYTTNTGSSGTVAQGVQHAYEIFVVGVSAFALDFDIQAYPNPTVDELILKISNINEHNLSFLVFDIQGKMLQTGSVSSEETIIKMSDYQSATYFIHLVNENSEQIQLFKIIKQ